MLVFTHRQLSLILMALDDLQGDLAADLNGWTIGECKEYINELATIATMYADVEILRKQIDNEISNDLPH